uniref:Plectrovirus spv1-r8a2b orf 6 transmembrane protein n=1 Tax=Spiroplasma citri TaxID=2133 RepID=Q14LD8_SPICI|nr:plectrovirus spv1-r8a2b orf 6 transmembrane protein [Spiroplasma citri]
MDMKFKTTKEYKKIKRNFIFLNLCFGFCYFLIFICSGFSIVVIIWSLNVGDIIDILISFFCLIASVSFLSLLIIAHIIQVKEFRVTVLKKQLLPLKIINNGVLGKGTMLRPIRRGDDKIE